MKKLLILALALNPFAAVFACDEECDNIKKKSNEVVNEENNDTIKTQQTFCGDCPENKTKK